MTDYSRRRLTIDGLPDDVLIEIFDFYVFKNQDLDLRRLSRSGIERKIIESWQSLVHVCRQWRGLVFGSPRRLNLQLCYTTRSTFMMATPERVTLDVWPALPLVVQGIVYSMNNFTPIFKHSDRISQIVLDFRSTLQTEKLWAAMEVPFLELAVLRLSKLNHPLCEIIPDSFLGESAPRLRYFYLDSIPFPGLPKLLLSATHLVQLSLEDIPRSGYISPETMATSLSMLTSLETLRLEFEYSQAYPDLKGRRSPPPTRFILPALTAFWFKGVSEYLERLVARIDSPRLHTFVAGSLEDIDFYTPELNQFISRTTTLGPYDEADLKFHDKRALVRLRQSHPDDHRMVAIEILSRVPDRLLSNLAQICTLSLRLLLTMENLYIGGNQYSPLVQKDDIEIKWLDLLLPFTAVKNFYLRRLFSPCIALALQELTGGRIVEVLPALQNVLLEGFQPSRPVQEGIAQFISARQLTNHPVAISGWD